MTPTITVSPVSTLAARAAAASSMRCLGRPSATALVMPPCASTSSISAQARSSSSRVSSSTYQLPPSGSATAVTPLSSARISCVLRAMRAREIGRQRDRFVEAVGVQRLRPAEHRRQRLDRGADDIVVRVLLGQADTPLVWQCVRSSFDFSDFAPRSVMIRAHKRPRRAQLRDLHEQVHADAEEEAQARREIVDVEAVGLRRAHIFHAVGERVGELLHRRRPGLVHVIAADRDRVELRHLRRAVGDDVR